LRKTLKNPIFGTNDDFILAALTQGKLSGQSYLTTYFLGIFVTSPAVFLSNLFPKIPAYSIVLLTFLVIVQGVFFATLIGIKNQSVDLISLTAVWVFYSINSLSWNYLNLTFTSIAIVISSLGIAIFFIYFFFTEEPRFVWVVISAAIVMIGTSLRKESVYIAALLSLFLLLALVLFNKEKKIFSTVGPLMIWPVFFAFFLVQQIINRIISSSNWQNYYALQSKISDIHPTDNNYLTTKFLNLQNVYNITNWDYFTLDLFKNFMLTDQDYMSQESILELTNQVNPGIFNAILYYIQNRPGLNSVLPYMLQFRYIFIFILILTLLATLRTKYRFRVFLLFAIPGMLFQFFMEFLSVAIKLPERIYFGLFTVIFIYVFVIFLLSGSLKYSKVSKLIINSIILIFSLMALSSLHSELVARDNFNYINKEKSKEQVKIFNSFKEDPIFIGNLSAIQASWISPYDSKRLENRLKNVIVLGWINTSPAWIDQIFYKGFEPSSFIAQTVELENIYYVVKNDVKNSLVEYLKMNTDTNIEFTVLYSNSEFSIIEFRTG
jgi:MFS family permease